MRGHFLLLLAVLPLATYGQNAADEYYDAGAMAAARERLRHAHGDQRYYRFMLERFEYQAVSNDAVLLLDADYSIGGDIHRFAMRAEAGYQTDKSQFEENELHALYSRAIHPFWNLNAGLRHDIRPRPSRSYAVFGVSGIAPYWFEIDANAFVSERGDISLRFEAEYDVRLTQRLLLQPRFEIDAALSDDTAVGVGSGVGHAQAGLRLRYEVRREFAPYIGVNWSRAYAGTADIIRAKGEDASHTSLVAGLRIWF